MCPGHEEKKLTKAIVGDIVNKEGSREAFRGVDCVIHCAALVSYRFPPDHEALDRVNFTGHIIIRYGVIATLPLNCWRITVTKKQREFRVALSCLLAEKRCRIRAG
jgi:hypothetical protein